MRRLIAHCTALVVMVMAVSASADDAQIAQQIIGKLQQQKQAASLKGFDLGVLVDKGTVTMMGQVSSGDQAMLALDIARRVPGVKLVVNDLYVKQAQQPTPAVRPVAAQTPVRPVAATQSVRYQPQPAAQQQVRPASYGTPVAAANYDGAVVDGGYAGGYTGEVVTEGATYGGTYGGSYAGVSENPTMPGHAWPSYASHPNYGAVTYPQQYSATAWPYIGPFYPYPQVPLGWRKVTLEWDDGWWFLDFNKK